MSIASHVAKSTSILIFFSIGSKFLGFIREALIAAKFGSGIETDAYFVASTTIALFTAMITNAINTTSIPVLSEIEGCEGKQGKIFHTNNLFNITMLISLIVILLAWAFTPGALHIIAYGFAGEQLRLAITLTRIGLLSIIFSGAMGVLRGFLQSESMFLELALTGFVLNSVFIFFLIFMAGSFGIKGLMVASVVATITQFVIQFPETHKSGFRYNLVLDLHDKYVKQIMNLVPPILGTVVINDINLIIDRTLASTLAEGSISALNYASKLESLVTTVFISAIITVIFPILSKKANKNSYDDLKKLVVKGLNIGLIITIPSTIGIVLLAKPIVQVVFQRGAFDETATLMTSGALIFYALGLASNGARMLLYRVYYSLQDTKTPMLNGVIAVFVNIVLNLILIRFMAHKGLALATSISSSITSILLTYGLRKKIGAFGFSSSLKCGIKSVIASAIMGVVVYGCFIFLGNFMGNDNMHSALRLLVSVGIGASIYLGLIYILRVEEARWFVGIIKNKLLSF